VHGLRLPAEQAWPAALQRQLGDGVEVLNWGVCGTSSDGLEDVARAAPRAGASVALLAIGNNEYTMAPFREGVGGRWPLLTDDLLMISSRAHIYGLLRTALLRHLPPSGPQRAFSHPRQADLSRLHGRPPPGLHDHPEGVADPELTALVEQARALDERYYQRRLRRMIADLQAHGVVPVVVSLPSHLEGRPTLAGSTDEAELSWIRATTAKAKAGDPRALDELLQIQPGNAFAWHLEGQRRARAKDRPGAAAAFRRAQDLDLLADGTTRIAALARAEAARAGAPFLDLEALGEAWLGDPTPWLDRIHVSAAGAEAVAAEVARGLRAHGLAPPPAPGG
jgi:lysophospholipase L1-like esterase